MSDQIVCPVTGRTWPGEWGFVLRTCVNCGGLIDTRREGWNDQVGKPSHPRCPERVTPVVIPGPVVAGRPTAHRLSGAELVEIANARDEVHDEAMALAAQRAEQEHPERENDEVSE